MEISDGQLLRELRRAIDSVAAEGMAAQVRAVEETLQRHNATMVDVRRALDAVKERRRRELAGLVGRLRALADGQEEAEETADSVDRFLRGISGSGRI